MVDTHRWHQARALALVALAIVLPAGARGRASPDELRVSAAPSPLTLGADAEAVLEVVGPDDVEELRVTCNLGSVEGVERAGPGRFRARYLPPPKTYPQVAIVSALATTPRGPARGWKAIPLWGQGDAAIRTRPGAQITVRIGDRPFGPVQANAAGLATVPIIVPPGVRQARHGDTPIDLGLPATPHLHIMLDQVEVPADRPAQIAVRAYAVSQSGEPRGDASFKAETTRGSLGGFAAVAPGVFEATWTLEPGRLGTETITARILGENDFPLTTQLRVLPGVPSSVVLSAERDQVVAGEGRGEVWLWAVAKDAAENPAAGTLRFESDFGTVSAPTTNDEGELRFVVRVPPAFGGRRQLTVRAVDAATGRELAAKVLVLRPGLPALRVEPSSVSASPDGSTGLAFTVFARDAFGNPLGDDALETTASLGTVLPPQRRAPGEFTLTWRPGPVAEPTDATIGIRAEGRSAVARARLYPPGGRLALSPRVGVLSNLGTANAFYAAGELGLSLRLSGQELVLSAEAGALFLTRVATVRGEPPETVGGRHRVYPIFATLAWRPSLGGRVSFQLAAGAGAALARSSVQIAGQAVPLEERSTVSAFHASMAVGCRLWRGGPFAEGRYWRVNDTGMASMRGALSALALQAGYRLELL